MLWAVRVAHCFKEHLTYGRRPVFKRLSISDIIRYHLDPRSPGGRRTGDQTNSSSAEAVGIGGSVRTTQTELFVLLESFFSTQWGLVPLDMSRRVGTRRRRMANCFLLGLLGMQRHLLERPDVCQRLIRPGGRGGEEDDAGPD